MPVSENLSGVLLAEDDVSIQRLVALALRRRGLTVYVAADGEEAIAELQSRRHSVLVLDLMMPKVSGWDLIDWLGQHPEHRPSSVIVVSAADRALLQNLDPTVVNAIIFKPFDVTQLAAYVRAAADRDDRDRRHLRVVTAG